jgi:hypothetical protein
LVAEFELIAFDGLPEIVLQFQTFQGVRVFVPVEDLEAGLCLALRPI